MREDRLISKSPYNYSQISGFIAVKQYMIVRSDGKKCALLRFVNEADYTVDYFDFTLIQLDSKGTIIDKTKVECKDLEFKAGHTYAMNKGVIVDEKCIDVRVQMISAKSGKYRYTVSGGRRVVAHYDCEETWKYIPSDVLDAKLRKQRQSSELASKKKEKHSYGLIRLIAVLAIIYICFINIQPYVDRLMSYMGLDSDYQAENFDLNSISGVDYVEI